MRRRMKLSVKSITDNNWEDIFWEDLAQAIVNDRGASRDHIVDLISRQRVAVMIYAPFLSEELDGVALDRLHCFFEFWNRWQNLSEKLLLLVCLSLKYQDRYDVTRRRYQIWKPEGLNERLRRYVMELDFRTYENLHGVCLPQLQAIPQSDAEAAVNNELVRQRYGFTDRDVIRIYKNRNLCTREGHIPMYTLLEQFSETLEGRHL